MAPKRRKTDFHLPPRVYIKHGAFYYVDIKNKWTRLGKNFSESMAAWAKIINRVDRIETMHQLFDRYMRDVAPLKAPSSYRQNIVQMKELRESFGCMHPEDITPVDVYKHLDNRAKEAPVSANREKALLSHCFSMAIRWGIVGNNPCKDVKRITEKPRDRHVENNEYAAVQSVAPKIVCYAMDFAYLTGQRIGDILKVMLTDLTDAGIQIVQSKGNGKVKLILEWSDELRRCVDNIMKLPRSSTYSLYLFCNEKGLPLTYNAFYCRWRKARKKAIQEGLIDASYTFHDLRAKSSTDDENRQAASDRLGHTDTKITERVYNRKPKKVSPLR